MIAQFPSLLPDELVYSLLARYHIQFGYMRYTFTAENLFQSKTVRPDIEFINPLTPAALQMITKDMSMEQVIEKHTMFNYYGRFLKNDRRNKAFESMINMQGNYNNLLPIPKRKGDTKRCLRYCPECAESDREQYGFTYWHRVHQMIGVNVCPIHGCKLIDTSVGISGKESPKLICAEMAIPEKISMPLCRGNEIEIKIARYIAKVFNLELDLRNKITIGKFLHSKMENTPYRSVRGEQRNIALFHADFIEFYRDLPDNHFTELWQIQKVLTDDRVNFFEICLLAMFLNISAADMVHMELPEQTQEQRFDKEVFRLHEQGLKYPEIARRLNSSVNVVKPIGERRYGASHKRSEKPSKGGSKAYDWQQIDRDTLPLVKDAIKQLQGEGKDRPKKITVFAVEKLLGLPSKRISVYLPECKAEVEKYQESQEKYWAREVAWAVNTIVREEQVLNWKHIRNLTNMRKCDLIECLPFIKEVSDDNIYQLVRGLV